jgi:hypothetical protein
MSVCLVIVSWPMVYTSLSYLLNAKSADCSCPAAAGAVCIVCHGSNNAAVVLAVIRRLLGRVLVQGHVSYMLVDRFTSVRSVVWWRRELQAC